MEETIHKIFFIQNSVYLHKVILILKYALKLGFY